MHAFLLVRSKEEMRPSSVDLAGRFGVDRCIMYGWMHDVEFFYVFLIILQNYTTV
jgi:hypothetical protein